MNINTMVETHGKRGKNRLNYDRMSCLDDVSPGRRAIEEEKAPFRIPLSCILREDGAGSIQCFFFQKNLCFVKKVDF